MLYTSISFLLIFFILIGLRWFNGRQNINLTKKLVHMNVSHTNLLKGIAILLVLMSHIANYRSFPVLIPLGGIGVALFLLCSGYGLNESYKKKGLKGFIKNRLIKILIPYWTLAILFWGVHLDTISINGVVESFILFNLPFMWFIQYIFIWYLLFYISKRFFNDFISTLLLFITGISLIFIFKDTIWGEQSLSFVIGVLISQYAKVKNTLINNKIQSLVLFLIIGIVFSGIFLTLKIDGMDIVQYYLLLNLVQILMKVSISLFIIQFTYCFKNYLYGSLMTVGIYSFEVYLSHTLVLDILYANQYYFMSVFFALVVILSIGINKSSSFIHRMIFKRKSEISVQ